MMPEFKIKPKSGWWRWIWLPSSWLAEEVVRLNCCSRYFPRKAAKPATTAISMQAASVMQLNTGLERRCLVTRGITVLEKAEKKRKRLQDRRSNTFSALKKWYDACISSSSHLLSLTSEMLTNRESTVHIEAMNGPFGFWARVLQGEGRRQHGLLALPSTIQVLFIQCLREAKHEEGRQEE